MFAQTQLTCPICQKTFAALVASRVSIGEKESDFCPRFLGMNPLPGLIHTCPDCGYTAAANDFVPLGDTRQIEKIRKALGKIADEPAVTATDKFRRLAMLLVQRNAGPLAVADAYLRASWCARLEANPSESACRAKAIQYFLIAWQAKEVPESQRPVVAYLIGELARRNGDMEKAREWFAKVDSTTAPPWLVQWRDKQAAKL